MVRESEARRVEQYCFSILNPGLIACIFRQHNLTNVFTYPLIRAASLPGGVVQTFEDEMNSMLNANKIKRECVTLDHVGKSGIINYAIHADSHQGIVQQLEQLDGFYRAWVA